MSMIPPLSHVSLHSRVEVYLRLFRSFSQKAGFRGNYFCHKLCSMRTKASHSPKPESDLSKELKYLYAQRGAVEALIRALEAYRQFSPTLVIRKTRTA